jgi:hypothetical protein
MNPLFMAGLELQQFMRARQWPFCFIGGLAVIRWGQVRMTQDIDLSVLSGFEDEQIYIDSLLSQFRSRIEDARNFALINRVLLLTASNNVSVDISLAGLPFEQQMIKRASPFSYAPDCSLVTCSAEDLIILKTFADRAIDWMDVDGILLKRADVLDYPYIIKQLEPLCWLKESPEIVGKLKQLIDKNKKEMDR